MHSPSTWPVAVPVAALRGEGGAQHVGAECFLLCQISLEHKGALGGTDRLQPKGEFSNEGQAAPTAAEQTHQVVARHVFHHPATGAGFHAIAAQQANTDDLIAHSQVALSQSTRQASGDKAADAALSASLGPIHRQPLPLCGQQGLQLLQRQAGFNGDRQIIHGVVDHPIQIPAVQHGVAWIQGWTPIQSGAQATGTPGQGVLMPLAHQVDQIAAAGGGIAHGTMVP